MLRYVGISTVAATLLLAGPISAQKVGTIDRARQFSASALAKLAPLAGINGDWSDDGHFWYLDRSGKAPTLVIGRPGGRSTHHRLPAFTDIDGSPSLDPALFDGEVRLAAADNTGFTLFLSGRAIRCYVSEGNCVTVGPQGTKGSNRSIDGKIVAESRDGALILRSENGEVVVPPETADARWSLAAATDNSAISDLRAGTTPTVGIWSPDSSTFLTFVMDEHRVRTLRLLESRPEQGRMPKAYSYHYPMPCDAELPIYRYRLVARNGRVTDVDLPPHANSFLDPMSIKEAWWAADGRHAYILIYNRSYTELHFYEIDAATGATQLLHKEVADYPLNPTYGFGWSDVKTDGREILWPSQKGGVNSLYLYARDGRELRRITPQNQFVRRVLSIDFKRRIVRYLASGGEPGDPYLRYVYSAGLDGGPSRRLTPEIADHEASASPNGRFMLDSYSRVDLPTRLVLRDGTGKALSTLAQASDQALRAIGWRPPEPFKVKARDGRTDLYGLLFLPSDYDPAKPYPLIEYSYPGPQAATVPKRFEQVLNMRTEGAPALAELGFIVMALDGMGKPFRSSDFSRIGLYHLEDAGIPDSLTAIDQLSRRYRIDRSRIGIYGNSAGGHASTRALLTHPEVYRAAFSMAGDHDIGLYSATWFERFGGRCPPGGTLPPDLFDKLSNSRLAGLLNGKLMLGYGELDDNVNPLNTVNLIQALREHHKDFDMLVVPKAGHAAIRDEMAQRAMWDFFMRNVRDVPTTSIPR